MLRAFDGKAPKVADSAFVSERAYVVGDVEIGENSGVWPGAVIRADFGSIRIGKSCQIEDNCVVHSGTDMHIGDNVMLGHSVVFHGLSVGNNVLIGNNATVLDFAEIGDRCVIGANSLVSTGQKIPPDSFVVGVPAQIKPLSPDQIKKVRYRQVDKYSKMRTGSGPKSYADLVRMYKQQGL